MSPELLNPDERNGLLGRTVYSDRYSFGMVIYEVRVTLLCAAASPHLATI